MKSKYLVLIECRTKTFNGISSFETNRLDTLEEKEDVNIVGTCHGFPINVGYKNQGKTQ